MARMSSKSSIPRLGRFRSTSGVGFRRSSRLGGPGRRRHGPGEDGTLGVLAQGPEVVRPGTVRTSGLGYKTLDGFEYYPEQDYAWPGFVQRPGCEMPLSVDCTQLQISPQWAIACFKPTYHRLRAMHGDDYHAILDDLIWQEIPACTIGGPATGAEYELYRRLQLAVAALMNTEGIPVRYPPLARFPRPPRAQQISQPWLRALLTGWV